MTRTLFLDIDGVLMAHTTGVPSKKLGFTDWRKLPKGERPFGWGGWISEEQLALIVDVFGNPGDRIVWLTTWELSAYAQGANKSFSDQISWKRNDVFPDAWLKAAYSREANSGLIIPESHWWKHSMVHKAHETKHAYAEVDQIVWVDDDMMEMNSMKAWDMLTEYRPEKTFRLVCPEVAWSRDSIESFRLEG